MAGHTSSRTIDSLLTDFGAAMPKRDLPVADPGPDAMFPRSRSLHGTRAPGHGWAASLPPLATYQMTDGNAVVGAVHHIGQASTMPPRRRHIL